MADAFPPTTRYARSGDVHIAYQVVGEGPIDIVFVPSWVSQVEHLWEDAGVRGFFRRLTRFARLILFDRRGTGLSDRVPATVTLEEQMDDVLAVMDAAGSRRAAMFAMLEGGQMAMLFAASFPERTSALVLYACWARLEWAPDYPWALRREERVAYARTARETWGTPERADLLAPSRTGDDAFRAWYAKLERLTMGPGGVEDVLRVIGETDVRHLLPSIRVPSLVLHRAEDGRIELRHSEYLAEHVPGARLVLLPGSDMMPSTGERDALVGEVEEFLTGTRRAEDEPDRVLATVLFTDIVGSTSLASELGDRRWRELLGRHHEVVRAELGRHRGREVRTIGDGFLATFDGPARAIRCARAVTDGVRPLGLDVRAGLHTGEVEVIGADVSGMAVHIGARVAALADGGEVLVSSTVRDLVVGSGIDFEDRGARELRGVPGSWRIFAVE